MNNENKICELNQSLDLNQPLLDEERWKLYYEFEKIIALKPDQELIKLLDNFTNQDFLSMPIVFDLISYKKLDLLKYLYDKRMPLTYSDWDGTNALHVACGAGGSLECVKFFIENGIITDINKESFNYGDTPLTLAISYRHKDIINYFKKKYQINNVSLKHLEVIIDRIITNYGLLAK